MKMITIETKTPKAFELREWVKINFEEYYCDNIKTESDKDGTIYKYSFWKWEEVR